MPVLVTLIIVSPSPGASVTVPPDGVGEGDGGPCSDVGVNNTSVPPNIKKLEKQESVLGRLLSYRCHHDGTPQARMGAGLAGVGWLDEGGEG